MEENKSKENEKIGLKYVDKNIHSKIFKSPTSKAKILTPIKSALYRSNGNTYKFLKEIQNIVDSQDEESKENIVDWETK